MHKKTIIIYCLIIVLFIFSLLILIIYYTNLNTSNNSRSIFVPLPIPGSMVQYVDNLSGSEQIACKNRILWENTPNINNKCAIRSMDDAYNWVRCNQPNVCDNGNSDRSIYCSKTNCVTQEEVTDNNETITDTKRIIDQVSGLLAEQGVSSNTVTTRCEKSIQNLLNYNRDNNDQILFINKIKAIDPKIDQKDIAHIWLMCNAQILCEPQPNLRCDPLTTLLGTGSTLNNGLMSKGLELNGINQNGGIYEIYDNYHGTVIFDRFSFIQDPDPMYGFNDNVSKMDALNQQLFVYNDVIKYNKPHKQCVIKVSPQTDPSGSIRYTVKLESHKSYNGGLFVMDVDHMPSGLSVWPIFSLTGKIWPCDGEIRIAQTTNSRDWETSQNFVSLHTDQICTQDSVTGITNDGMCGAGRQYSGNKICRPCDRHDGNDCPYDGCGVYAGYGTAGASFNKQGGGVFVCEWIYDGTIKIWIFPRNRVPEYVPFHATKLDTTRWPNPHVEFKSCPGSFKNNYITLSTTLCGHLANEYFINRGSETCSSYVANPGSDFNDAKWVINYIKVFQRVIISV